TASVADGASTDGNRRGDIGEIRRELRVFRLSAPGFRAPTDIRGTGARRDRDACGCRVFSPPPYTILDPRGYLRGGRPTGGRPERGLSLEKSDGVCHLVSDRSPLPGLAAESRRRSAGASPCSDPFGPFGRVTRTLCH